MSPEPSRTPTPSQGRPPGSRLSEQCLRAYVPGDVARQVDEYLARTGETRSSWLRRLVIAEVGSEPRRASA